MKKPPTDFSNYKCIIRDGGDVFRMKDKKSTGRRILGKLKLGERLDVPTLFGRCIATVECVDENSATAMSGRTICWLQFSNDDRKCWTSSMSGNSGWCPNDVLRWRG